MITDKNENQPPIEIPIEILSPDALQGIIDQFIFREGTDYGSSEVPHEVKVEQIRSQLRSSQIKIVFDPASESVTLMALGDWKKTQA
jgi:uncharacterized protein YheU (UPF0270 family)